MLSRPTLRLQVFLAIALVAVATALAVGVTTRVVLSRSFDAYLATYETAPCPTPTEATSTAEASTGAGRGNGNGLGSATGGAVSTTATAAVGTTATGQGFGRRALGAAEQQFLSTVDLWVGIAAALALTGAVVVSLVLARRLASPLHNLEVAAGALAGGDLSVRANVTGPEEVAALGETFNEMADSIQRAEELRKRLVADVAHELRNPLAAARGQAEGMADGIIAADAVHLNSVLEDLEHLSVLIDDLHDLSVAESGKMRYIMEDIDLAQLVRDEASHAEALVAPGVSLRVETADRLMARGDARRLSQVMRNLLTNAARHTTSGAITVTAAPEGVGQLRVSVSDSGSGIAAEDLPFVFERFYRADSQRSAGTGGAGLGLAISRSIIRDHGGEVFAESTAGVGSEIGFTIPVPLA